MQNRKLRRFQKRITVKATGAFARKMRRRSSSIGWIGSIRRPRSLRRRKNLAEMILKGS